VANAFVPDLKNTHSAFVSVAPQTIASATTTNGSSVDLNDCHGSVHVLVATGNCGDSTLTLDIKLQQAIEDSANPGTALSSDWSDCTPNGAFSQLAGATAADNLGLILSHWHRSKRFVRVVVTTAGGGTLSVPISALVLSAKKIVGSGTGTYSA
jgi:hypothetical protein